MRSIRIAFAVLFGLAAAGVFAFALINPAFRASAYAPLREVLLPDAQPIIVDTYYSTEKEEWLDAIMDDFYATDPRVNGRPAQIELSDWGSREMYLAVLDGDQPHLISPASSLQVRLLDDLSAVKFGESVINTVDPNACRSVVQTPLVLVSWEERADVLWGRDPGRAMWDELQAAVTDPAGWDSFGHPEWGYVKIGHTNPLTSNSGFMTFTLMTYDYFGITSGLTSQDILSRSDYQAWVLGLEGSITEFGNSTGTYMREIVAFGPSLYDVAAVIAELERETREARTFN